MQLAKIDLDAVAIHQLMSMEKYDVAKRIYLEGHNYYDYDNKEEFNFVSLYNFTQKKTIDYTEFAMYQLFDEQLDGGYKAFVNTLIVDALDRTGIFQSTSAAQRELAVDVTISSFVSYMSALEALYYSSSVCYKKNKVASTAAFDGAVALLVGSVEGRGLGGSVDQEGRMFYSISKRTCNHFDTCVGETSVWYWGCSSLYPFTNMCLPPFPFQEVILKSTGNYLQNFPRDRHSSQRTTAAA